MPNQSPQPDKRRFGRFELAPANRELRRDGKPVKLQAQHFQLLQLLAARPGQVVTREEIRQALWGGETFVDFDRSINFGVNKIREALKDDPRKPRYIETVPRKGYRFLAQAEESPNEDVLPATADRPNPAWRWWVAAGLALLTIALSAWMMGSRTYGAKRIESLAVLPLENLSPDPDQDYFASGMTEELITALARIGTLRVVPRMSVSQYAGTKKPLSQIARELNVDALIEGSVTRDGDRVRITAQLIVEEPERHLWAEKYEASTRDILNMQDEVAKAVARAIQRRVTPGTLSTHRTVDPAAYEAYLRGMYLNLNATEANLKESVQYLQQAIDRAPNYAPAWAELGDSYQGLAAYGVLTYADAYTRARAAAEKALQLDPGLLLPILTLAKVKQNYEWDWVGAEREYRRAIALNPNSVVAYMYYSGELSETGRTAEAVSESLRARELAPVAYFPNVQVAWRYYLNRQYDQAVMESLKLIEWKPEMSWGYICRASAFQQNGHRREAVADLRKAVEVSKRGVFELMYLGHGLGISGVLAEGRAILEEMLALSRTRHVPPEFVAVVYEGLGDRERAIQWFKKACAEKSMHPMIVPDPRLDAIRSDVRFTKLMQQMGLAR